MQRNRIVRTLERLTKRGWIEKLPSLTLIVESGGRRIATKIEDIRAPPNYTQADVWREVRRTIKEGLLEADKKVKIDRRTHRETVADVKWKKRVRAFGRQIPGYENERVDPFKLRYYSLARRQHADFGLNLDPTDLFTISYKDGEGKSDVVNRFTLKVGYMLSKVPKEMFAWAIMNEWDKWVTQSELDRDSKLPNYGLYVNSLPS